MIDVIDNRFMRVESNEQPGHRVMIAFIGSAYNQLYTC